MSYDAPFWQRFRWRLYDVLEVIAIVLGAIAIIFVCAIILGFAVRASFWAAGIDW